MWWLGFCIVSTSIAFVAGGWLGWRAHARLVTRLRTVAGTLEVIRDLENRRVGVESGRDQLVRARAGKRARINEGMASKPGVLGRYLRDTPLTNNFIDPNG